MPDRPPEPLTGKVAVISQAVVQGFWLRLVKWAVTLASSVLVVRMLGKEGYGFLSIVKIFVTYGMVLYTLCMDQALLRYLPEIRARGGRRGIFRFLRKTFFLQFFLWLFFLAVVFLLSGRISGRLGGGIQGYLWVAVLLSFFTFLHLDLSQALTTFYELRVQLWGGAFGGLVLLLLLVGFLHFGAGIWGVLLAEGVVMAGLSFLFLKRLFALSEGGDAGEKAFEIPLLRVFKFSFPYVCMTLLNQVIWRQSELFFLAHYESPSVVGIYNVGFTLPQLALEFIPSFMASIGIVGAVEQFMKGVDHLSRGITLYYKVLFFLMAPLVTGGALFSDRLILHLYGPEFALSGIISQIYFVLFLGTFLLVPYGLAMMAEEKIWISVLLSVPVCALNLVLDFWWIGKFGLWGAVGAVAVTHVFGFLLIFFSWKKVYPYVRIPWRFIGKCFLATAPFLIFFPMKGFSESPFWFLFLCLGMGGSYLLAVRGIRLFGPEEIALVEQSPLLAKPQILKFLKR